MYSNSAEVLNDLRILIELEAEAHQIPLEGPERTQLESQLASYRNRLPLSILSYHDARVEQSLPTLGRLNISCCENCGSALSADSMHLLQTPGCFVVCVQCGVFVYDERKAGHATRERLEQLRLKTGRTRTGKRA